MRPLRRVLYVEDEPDIRTIASLALERVGGLEVRLAASGAEALATAQVWAPDLVVLDVMMPEMDGPATLRELRKEAALQHVPVVFMTAKVQNHEVAALRALGVAEVLAKPFDPMTLARSLEDVWRRVHGG